MAENRDIWTRFVEDVGGETVAEAYRDNLSAGNTIELKGKPWKVINVRLFYPPGSWDPSGYMREVRVIEGEANSN